MANLVGSAFYSDSLRLDLKDITEMMVFGRTVKVGNLVIGYERQPDNGCRCQNCSELFAALRSADTGEKRES